MFDGNQQFTYIRCASCHNVFLHPNWGKGMECPECKSRDTAPAPVIEGALEYSLASRETGPTIEDIRLARVVTWLGLASRQALAQVLREQVKLASDENSEVPPLGDILIREGILKDYQLNTILRETRPTKVPETWAEFGYFAYSAELVTKEQLDVCSRIQSDLITRGGEFAFIGNLFIEMACCKEGQVLRLLQLQKAKLNEGFLKELEDKLAQAAREHAAKPIQLVRAATPALKRNIKYVALSIFCVVGLIYAIRNLPAAEQFPSRRVALSCERCGRAFPSGADRLRAVCLRCGGRTGTSLFCGKCKRHFPLRLAVGRDGRLSVTPCPGCRDIEGVVLPKEYTAIMLKEDEFFSCSKCKTPYRPRISMDATGAFIFSPCPRCGSADTVTLPEMLSGKAELRKGQLLYRWTW